MKPFVIFILVPFILSLDSCIVVEQATVNANTVTNTMPDKEGLCYYVPPVMKEMPLPPKLDELNGHPELAQRLWAQSLLEHRRYINEYMIQVNNDYVKYRERCHF